MGKVGCSRRSAIDQLGRLGVRRRRGRCRSRRRGKARVGAHGERDRTGVGGLQNLRDRSLPPRGGGEGSIGKRRSRVRHQAPLWDICGPSFKGGKSLYTFPLMFARHSEGPVQSCERVSKKPSPRGDRVPSHGWRARPATPRSGAAASLAPANRRGCPSLERKDAEAELGCTWDVAAALARLADHVPRPHALANSDRGFDVRVLGDCAVTGQDGHVARRFVEAAVATAAGCTVQVEDRAVIDGDHVGAVGDARRNPSGPRHPFRCASCQGRTGRCQRLPARGESASHARTEAGCA